MGKNNKKKGTEPAPPSMDADGHAPSDGHDAPMPGTTDGAVRSEAGMPPPSGRLRRLLPDLIKAAIALGAVAVGVVVWYKPLLIRADFPHLSYRYEGALATDAVLYRPLAMPTRYYIELPRTLANRYQWFAVDRRREVAALTEAPCHRVFGQKAIKRSDPLGLDLEFRKFDGSEWQVHFFSDAIVFSNAVLTIRMDTKEAPKAP